MTATSVTHADAAVVLVYYGALLVVACMGGWLGEKYLLRRDRKRGLA